MPKSKPQHAFAYFILISSIVVVCYIVIVAIDWRIPYINSPDPKTITPINLDVYLGNDTSGIPDLNITLFIRYNGFLIAGSHEGITMSGFGYLNTQKALDIEKVNIGFKTSLAFPPSVSANGVPIANSLSLHHVDKTNQLIGDDVQIYFPTSGEYYPNTVSYSPTTAFQTTFSNSVLYLESTTELLTEKVSRVNLGLTYAVTFFAFIGALDLFFKYRSKQTF